MPTSQPEQAIDLPEMVGEFERKLDRLKVLYEQYFMGIEKREPTVPLKDLVRIMHEIDQHQIRNTGLRFRYRTLVQKFNTYKTYWHRTLRAIENGTYARDVARLSRSLARKGIAMPQVGRVASAGDVERAMAAAARAGDRDADPTTATRDRREAGDSPPIPKAAALRDDDDDDDDSKSTHPALPAVRIDPRALPPELGLAPIPDDEVDEDEETNPGNRGPAGSIIGGSGTGPIPQRAMMRGPNTGPVPPPPPPAAALRPRPAPQPRPAATGQPGLSDDDMRSLFRRFVKAKQMCGEDVSHIKYESLVKSVTQQLPKLQAQHQGREVEFQVVIREGRAILRARPK